VTSTPVSEPWSHTTVFDEDLVEQVRELKSRKGADIGVHGSVELAQGLLRGRLVDELRLVVAPALQAHGRKLFDDVLSTRLTLTGHALSPSGYLLLDFHLEHHAE
jgi:dihydrofolate reductase